MSTIKYIIYVLCLTFVIAGLVLLLGFKSLDVNIHETARAFSGSILVIGGFASCIILFIKKE